MNLDQAFDFYDESDSIKIVENCESTFSDHLRKHSSTFSQPINLMIIREESQNRCEKQLIQNFDFASLQVETDIIDLKKVLFVLQNYCAILVQNSQILVYFPLGQIYVNYGRYPLLEGETFNLKENINDERTLTIKILRELPPKLFFGEMLTDISKYTVEGPPKIIKKTSQRFQELSKKKSTTKKGFQKIGYIVKKVLRTIKKRKNKQFYEQEDHDYMSRKSLQDYFYQIKLGYKFKFNFNQFSTREMKYLRNYVKEKIQQQKIMKSLQEEQSLIGKYIKRNPSSQ